MVAEVTDKINRNIRLREAIAYCLGTLLDACGDCGIDGFPFGCRPKDGFQIVQGFGVGGIVHDRQNR